MNTNMKVIYEQFRNEPGFMIVSHTCNPDTDSGAFKMVCRLSESGY